MRIPNPAHVRAAIEAEVMKRRLKEKMHLQPIKEVEKSWGFEWWIVNTPDYCGKKLMVRRGKWSSKGKYHYHKIKDETFYVTHGHLLLDYVDKQNIFHSLTLTKGQAFRIEPGIKHRFSTHTVGGCRFIEFSTQHSDEDSYRCYYNKEKGEWIDD